MGFGSFLRAVGAQITPGGGTYRSTYDDEEQRRREAQQVARNRQQKTTPLQVNPAQSSQGLQVQRPDSQQLQVQKAPQQKINITNVLDDMHKLYVGNQLIKRDPAARVAQAQQPQGGFNLGHFVNELTKDTVGFVPRLAANYSQVAGNLGTKLAGGKAQNTEQFWRGTPGAEQAVRWSGATGTVGQTVGDVGQLGLAIASGGTGLIGKGLAKPVATKAAQVGYDAALGGAFNLASAQSQGELTKKNALQTAGIGAAFGAGGNLALSAGAKAYNSLTGKGNVFQYLANESDAKKVAKTLKKHGFNLGDIENVAKSIAKTTDENEIVRILTDPSNIAAGSLGAGLAKDIYAKSTHPEQATTPKTPEIDLPFEPPEKRPDLTPEQKALIEDRLSKGLDPQTGEPVNARTLGLDKPVEDVWQAPAPKQQSSPLQVNPSGSAAPTAAVVPPNPIRPTNQSGVRNQVSRALTDEDTVIIRELKNIEKQSGLNGLVDQFYYDSGLQRRANSIANTKFQNSPEVQDALGGLSKGSYKGFNEYATARRELANSRQGLPTSKDPAELKQIVNNAHPELVGRFDSLRDYYRGLAKELHDAGVIDESRFKQFTSDDDYIRLQRNMDDLFNRPQGAGKSYSLGQTFTRFKRTGSQRAVEPTGQTALDYTQRVQMEIQRNQTANHLIDALHSAGEATQLVNSEKVLARRELYQFLANTKPGKELVGKLLKRSGKDLRIIQGEVDKLNEQGLEAYLKRSEKDTLPSAFSYKNVDEVASPSRITVPKNIKKSISAPSEIQGTMTTRLAIDRPSSKEIRSAVSSLFAEDPDGINAIKRKLAVREPKATALLDEVQGLRDQQEAFGIARNQAFLKARSLADQSTKNKNTIRRIVKGIPETFEVSPEIREAVEHINPYQLNGLMKIVAAPGRILRAGTTALNPVFTASNYARDQLTSAILSRDAPRTSIHFAEGLGNAIAAAGDMNHRDLWQKFISHSGDTTSYDMTRNIQKSGKVIRGVRLGKRGKALNAAIQPVRTLEDLNSITEKATRFQNFKGIYNKVLKDTGDESRALREATLAAWQTTIDFNRAGTWGRVMNLIFPYSNPGIQGTRQTLKTFKSRPLATTLKGTALVGLPLATATLWNLSDPKRKAVYDNISDFEKENNIVIVLPGTKQNKDGTYNVIKIAQPPGLGSLWQPFRRSMEAYVGDKHNVATEMMGDVLKTFAGPVNFGSKSQLLGSITPQAIKPAIQAGMNRDLFTGKQTVPDYMKDANATDQAYPFTSGTASGIAKKTGTSPIGVEKFIGDTFGSLGKYGLNAVDSVLAKRGVVGKDQIGGESIGRGFQRRFALASGKYNYNKSEGAKFYEDVDKATKGAGLNKNELEAFNGTIMPAKKDFLGNTLNDKTYYDSANKATTWLRYPKTFETSKQIDAASRKRGNPGDPLFDLDSAKQKVILNLMSNYSPGNYEEKAITKLNPWIKDFYKQREGFFDEVAAKSKDKISAPESKGKNLTSTEKKQLDGLKKSVSQQGIDPRGMKIPKADDNLQKKLDDYGSITDGKQKHQYSVDNPEVADFFTQLNDYKRAKRSFLGLPQFDNYPTPDANTQKIMDAYSKLPQHEGHVKRDGTKASDTRSAWIKSHPKEWATMGTAFDKIAAWNAADEGALAVYEGLNAEGNPEGTPLKAGSSGSGGSINFGGFGKRESVPNITNFVDSAPAPPFSPVKKMTYKKLPSRLPPKSTAKKINITGLTLPTTRPTFNSSNSKTK